jgi:hypothetical protein
LRQHGHLARRHLRDLVYVEFAVQQRLLRAPPKRRRRVRARERVQLKETTMTPTHQILVILPLLVAPLAFSVAFGGGREGTRTPAAAAPAAMRGPGAATPRFEPAAPPAPRPSRIARDEPKHEATRSVEVPAGERSESLATLPSPENGAEDTPAHFAPMKDRAQTEQMTVAATAPSTLDAYGAAQD